MPIQRNKKAGAFAQQVNLTTQFYGNAARPPGASPWSMRLQIAFLFPKMPKK